jgi:hypothetical protein
MKRHLGQLRIYFELLFALAEHGEHGERKQQQRAEKAIGTLRCAGCSGALNYSSSPELDLSGSRMTCSSKSGALVNVRMW